MIKDLEIVLKFVDELPEEGQKEVARFIAYKVEWEEMRRTMTYEEQRRILELDCKKARKQWAKRRSFRH